MKRNIKFLTVILGVGVFAGVLITGMNVSASYPYIQLEWYLNTSNFDKAVEVFNENCAGASNENEYAEKFEKVIEKTVSRWEAGELDYKKASSYLEEISEISKSDVAKIASTKKSYVNNEGYGSEQHRLAAKYYAEGEFAKAMLAVSKISEDYSQYIMTVDLYNVCEATILKEVEKPVSVDDYERFIKKLEHAFEIIPETEFVIRKEQLENEMAVFKDIMKIEKEAVTYYVDGAFTEAFAALENGMALYPESEKLVENYEFLHNKYVTSIEEKVMSMCEIEEYKGALEVVEQAMDIHNCEELQELREYVKGERNILYKWKNNILDFLKKL